ncbi:ubiquitin-protein ligase E3 Brl2 [Trifolium repens]|nr:ubiquitin-protein ligase E3 Brl2 [Trifolium repens]
MVIAFLAIFTVIVQFHKRKNMAQISMLVYALIIFLSLYLVVTNGEKIPCVVDSDCPYLTYPLYNKCIDNFCKSARY